MKNICIYVFEEGKKYNLLVIFLDHGCNAVSQYLQRNDYFKTD